MTASPASQDLTDLFAMRILSGQWPPGHRFTLEELCEETGKSRTVAREIMRDLEGLRLVVAKRRVGMEVQHAGAWNVFDPRIIRVRLESQQAQEQYRSLMELRRAVEPVAGELCARRAGPQVKEELAAVAAAMRVEGRAGRLERFLELDVRFHELILLGSGNEMFAALAGDVEAVLRSRTNQGRMPAQPEAAALDLHEEVASAVCSSDGDAARFLLERLVEEARVGVERGFQDGASSEQLL